MEQLNRRSKSTRFSQLASSKQIKTSKKVGVPFTNGPNFGNLFFGNSRPLSSKPKSSRKLIKCHTTRNSMQRTDLQDLLFQKQNKQKQDQVYYSKRLTLSDSSFIFNQDAFKLQNFISGGYCCDDQFMSLSKFNTVKDNFILLQEIYDKAKTHPKVKDYQKQPNKSRNIFSVIYLNQNLKKMNKKQTNTIFSQLKICR